MFAEDTYIHFAINNVDDTLTTLNGLTQDIKTGYQGK